MFTSQGLFSEIICPYNAACVLPNCLFAHPVLASSNPTFLQGGGSLEESAIGIEKDEGGPRKRRKLDEDGHVTSKRSVEITETVLKPKASFIAVNRAISPPPLRRDLGASTNTSVVPKQYPPQKPPREDAKKVSTLSDSYQVPVKKAITKSSPQAPQAQVKLAVLNPRMLKHSPASHDIRYRLLKALHDHLARLNTELRKDADKSEAALVLSDQEVIIMALDLEEKVATEKPTIYTNIVKNHILAYKRLSVKEWKEERLKEIAKAKALRAPKNVITTATDSPILIDTGLSEEEELAFLPQLYAPVQLISKYGYVTSIPTQESIEVANKGIEAAKGWEVCDRCRARFQVFPGRREEDGALTSGGSCKYHWGKPYFQDRDARDPKAKREKKYRCCGEGVGDSTGCTTAEAHVFKVSEAKRLAALLNFEETPPNDNPYRTPVCLDGEMGYTVHGLELIRLTATSWPSGEEILDILVRPIGEVLDLNSRWSGVSPQQMANAVPWSSSGKHSSGQLRIASSLTQARGLLFSQLSPTTPLIGHGLENDLNAIRIIHPTIIDTALLFPHKAGLPYRNSLKVLMQQHLNRIIQSQVVIDGKMEGHDSKEDANAAGDLVRWKIGEKWKIMKLSGWKIEDGKFTAPKGTVSPPRSHLSVEFLEMESSGSSVVAGGKKRTIADISGGDIEDGEIGDE
jgi:RNA exonuclease 1